LRREPADPNAYAFEHILVRDVAYEQMPRGERAHRHRLVAEWLSGLPGRGEDRAELLAYHYWTALELARAAALPSDDLVEPAVEQLVLAGRRARRLHAYAEAIDYLERALRLAADVPDVLGELGQSLQAVGRKVEARAAFERALATAEPGDGIGRARLLRLLAGTLTSEYLYGDADAAYDRAEVAVAPLDDDDRRREWIQIQIDRLTLLYWRQDAARMNAVIERARPLVEQVGTASQQAEFLASQYLVRLSGERFRASDETVEISRRFLEARKALGDRVDIARARFNLGYVVLTRGEADDALEHLHAALTVAERTGSAILRARCLAYIAIAHRRGGDVDASRKTAEEGLAVATELGMPEYLALARANLGWAAWREGDREAAAADEAEALALFGRSASRYPFEWLARFPLLALALERCDADEAREQARGM